MVQEPVAPEADEKLARKTASEVAADAQKNGKSPADLNEVKFRSGLIIGVREVPPLILRQPLEKLPEPQPPMIPLPDKGKDIHEPNPNDPDYIADHEQWELTVGLSIMDTMLLLGTTEPQSEGDPKPLIQHCPENVLLPETEGWINWLEAAGVVVDVSTPNTRYLCWLRYYAASNASDLARLTAAIAGKSGVREEDVALAAQAFQGDAPRGTDPDSASQPNRADRRAVQRSRPRHGSGGRGKGRI